MLMNKFDTDIYFKYKNKKYFTITKFVKSIKSVAKKTNFETLSNKNAKSNF